MLGSGHLRSEVRSIGEFDEVAVHGLGELTIQLGTSEGLTIQADDNLLPQLGAQVEQRRLILEPLAAVSLRPKVPIKYTLTVKRLNAVEATGTASVRAIDLREPLLDIDLSDASRATISGTVAQQHVLISGSSQYDADGLASKWVSIDASGAAHASVRAIESLDAIASGTSRVLYSGSPSVKQRVSDAASVRKR